MYYKTVDCLSFSTSLFHPPLPYPSTNYQCTITVFMIFFIINTKDSNTTTHNYLKKMAVKAH